jgi:hypothetical protein
MRHGSEAIDHNLASGFIDPDGHGEAAVMQLFVEHLDIAMQP